MKNDFITNITSQDFISFYCFFFCPSCCYLANNRTEERLKIAEAKAFGSSLCLEMWV